MNIYTRIYIYIYTRIYIYMFVIIWFIYIYTVYIYTHYFCQCTMLYYHSCLVREQKESNLVDQSHLYYIIGIYKWNLQVILVYIWGISTVDPSKPSEAIKKTQHKSSMSTEMVFFGASEVVLTWLDINTLIYIHTHMYTRYMYMYMKGYAIYVML